MKLGIIMTCFNRKEKTKKCLEILKNQNLPKDCSFQVFICDDGSTDGTSDMLSTDFSEINVINGNGNLYWNGGTNMAWETAKKSSKFDFFLWLNDDTYLLENALIDLLKQFDKLKSPAILVGACLDPRTKQFSFGGSLESSPVIPNGSLQEVELVNGNVVLIPEIIDKKLKGLSPIFTHYLGDYDYGLRAQNAGFKCYSSENYIAECEPNNLPFWGDNRLKLSKRWKLVHNVKGLALSEYYQFLKIHKGRMKALSTLISVYLRVLVPSLFFGLRKFLNGR
jgi:GT2 family glycosyltransferase